MRSRLPLLAFTLVALAGPLQAQSPFSAGTNYIGPFVSLATYGGSAAFGGAFEHAINEKWGWGISGSFWSYSDNETFEGYESSASFTSYVIGGTAAYHFRTSDAKFDPFVGGFIGYYGCSGSFKDNAGTSESYDCGHSSGLLPGGFGGVRYWVKDNLALTGRLGFGVGTLAVGVDFKM